MHYTELSCGEVFWCRSFLFCEKWSVPHWLRVTYFGNVLIKYSFLKKSSIVGIYILRKYNNLHWKLQSIYSLNLVFRLVKSQIIWFKVNPSENNKNIEIEKKLSYYMQLFIITVLNWIKLKTVTHRLYLLFKIVQIKPNPYKRIIIFSLK